MSERGDECVICCGPVCRDSCCVEVLGTGQDGNGNVDVRGLSLKVCRRCFELLTDVDAVISVLRYGIREKERSDEAKAKIQAVPT